MNKSKSRGGSPPLKSAAPVSFRPSAKHIEKSDPLEESTWKFFANLIHSDSSPKTKEQKCLETRLLTVLEETQIGQGSLKKFLQLPTFEITCQWGMSVKVYELLSNLALRGGIQLVPFRNYPGFKRSRKVKRYMRYQR